MSMLTLAQSGASAGVIIGMALLGVVVAAVIIVAKLAIVGNPSEMLIISGKRQRNGSGYRVLIGGRTLVIPVIEKVARLTLRNMQVSLEVKATDNCGNSAEVDYDPTQHPSPLCDLVNEEGVCCPPIVPPEGEECNSVPCGR